MQDCINLPGAEGGSRTPMPSRAHDFESRASANSATSARLAVYAIQGDGSRFAPATQESGPVPLVSLAGWIGRDS